ncbi:MAG TPA: radical SAM protein [Thermoplasmata archaeon]|nr:radical SAM protein [Thermoplasmata archaeon]
MKIFEIHSKTALSKSRLAGLKYALNPYRGCAHGCGYCYAPSVLHVSSSDWGEWVGIKINLPNLLPKELREKERGTIGIGTVTDPYQPAEKDYKITRYSLEQILKADWPIVIQTKSDLVLRDLDLLRKFSRVEVIMTITTLNDAHRALLEANSPSIEKRLFSLKKLSSGGIPTCIFLGPAYPSISIGEIPRMVERFVETGAAELIVDRLNLKSGIQEKINFALRNNKDLQNLFERNSNAGYYTLLFKEIEKECKGKIKFTDSTRGKYEE